MNEKVQIINKSKNPLPKYQTSGSAGMDLMADLEQPITLKPMERILIPTGVYISLPEGYVAKIYPRSGLSSKKGLTLINSVGVIDSDYTGNIMAAMINLSNEYQIIENGDRICQLIISKYEKIDWIEVDELAKTERNDAGFGSTGVK